MLKVRDQDLCRTGSVLFVRQPCGRYDERESEEQIMTEMQGRVLDKDRLPWMGLVTREFALERPGVCFRNAHVSGWKARSFRCNSGHSVLNAWLFGSYGSPNASTMTCT